MKYQNDYDQMNPFDLKEDYDKRKRRQKKSLFVIVCITLITYLFVHCHGMDLNNQENDDQSTYIQTVYMHALNAYEQELTMMKVCLQDQTYEKGRMVCDESVLLKYGLTNVYLETDLSDDEIKAKEEASCISMGEFICKKNELCVCIQ